tara:strand:- start:432 stop:665 length:234 start_codon:yes stop_codon:yes gene_type:complete
LLQYKNNHIHGNSYFRLFKKEVKALVIEKYGADYLENKVLENELSVVKTQLRRLNKEIRLLEKKRIQLEHDCAQKIN